VVFASGKLAAKDAARGADFFAALGVTQDAQMLS
jgi:hypothetical protein